MMMTVDPSFSTEKDSWGLVPNSIDIDYFGVKALMKPSTFLSLAHPLTDATKNPDVFAHVHRGGVIAPPFIGYVAPPEWDDGDFSNPAKIVEHEGRNRLTAWMERMNDEPVIVHLFIRYWRSRDFNKNVLNALNRKVINQSGKLVYGPFFKLPSITNESLLPKKEEGNVAHWVHSDETRTYTVYDADGSVAAQYTYKDPFDRSKEYNAAVSKTRELKFNSVKKKQAARPLDDIEKKYIIGHREWKELFKKQREAINANNKKVADTVEARMDKIMTKLIKISHSGLVRTDVIQHVEKYYKMVDC